ncbi:hypothetical protein GCM10022215_42170 [Nocardioides fonticola]|uniref:Uncharacterized protein n=1 Tax=Nocardioides fonticola TaxID=450363 RepID=A0ABP7Y2F1_9ACTN
MTADATASGGGLGVLDDVVTLLRAEGHEVVVRADPRVLHGDPPRGRVRGGVGRGALEALCDLGPRLAWTSDGRGWSLIDRLTRASLDLGRAPDDDAPLTPPASRPAVGWHPDAAWEGWRGGPALELERLAAPGWRLPPVGGGAGAQPAFHLGHRRVRFAADVTAEEGLALLLASLRGLLEADPSGVPLDQLPELVPELVPEQVRAAVQPPWWTPSARAARAGLADLRGRALRHAAWRQRWAPEEIARHLDPDRRIWEFLGARVVGANELDLAWTTPWPGGPLDLVVWLLDAVGATGCEGQAAPLDPVAED